MWTVSHTHTYTHHPTHKHIPTCTYNTHTNTHTRTRTPSHTHNHIIYSPYVILFRLLCNDWTALLRLPLMMTLWYLARFDMRSRNVYDISKGLEEMIIINPSLTNQWVGLKFHYPQKWTYHQNALSVSDILMWFSLQLIVVLFPK